MSLVTYTWIVTGNYAMDKSAKKRLQMVAPGLDGLAFDSIDTLVQEISANNRLLWPTVDFLIYQKLRNYFDTEENLQITRGERIYDNKYFTQYPSDLEVELSDKLDLTFPRRQMSGTLIISNLGIFVAWTTLIFWLLFSYPELLLSGPDLIIQNGLLIIMTPYLILFFASPKWIKKREFRNIKTFADLTDFLSETNLWRYRASDFNRLKRELRDFVKSP